MPVSQRRFHASQTGSPAPFQPLAQPLHESIISSIINLQKTHGQGGHEVFLEGEEGLKF